MEPLSSFRDVIALWRSPGELARAIGAPVSGARKWAQRDRIPDPWWRPIADSEVGQRNGVTVDLLASLAARKREGTADCIGAAP